MKIRTWKNEVFEDKSHVCFNLRIPFSVSSQMRSIEVNLRENQMRME